MRRPERPPASRSSGWCRTEAGEIGAGIVPAVWGCGQSRRKSLSDSSARSDAASKAQARRGMASMTRRALLDGPAHHIARRPPGITLQAASCAPIRYSARSWNSAAERTSTHPRPGLRPGNVGCVAARQPRTVTSAESGRDWPPATAPISGRHGVWRARWRGARRALGLRR